MNYDIELIAKTLKATRVAKGLSQRALSNKAGVPQGHISKIENGIVDLRLSSLIALARVLDLELTLVPRKALSAVKSIVQSTERSAGGSGNSLAAMKELTRLQKNIAGLTQVRPAIKNLAQIQRQVRELGHLQFARPEIETIRNINKTMQAFKKSKASLDSVREAISQIPHLRNAMARMSANVPQIESGRPAYSLDEDDHG